MKAGELVAERHMKADKRKQLKCLLDSTINTIKLSVEGKTADNQV